MQEVDRDDKQRGMAGGGVEGGELIPDSGRSLWGEEGVGAEPAGARPKPSKSSKTGVVVVRLAKWQSPCAVDQVI